MPKYIIYHNGAYNIYSTIVDCAIFDNAFTKDELIKYMRDEYGNSCLGELEHRLERAHNHGCSSFDLSLDDCIAENHQGVDGTNMPKEEFIEKYLTLKINTSNLSDDEVNELWDNGKLGQDEKFVKKSNNRLTDKIKKSIRDSSDNNVTIPRNLCNILLEIAHMAWHHMDNSEHVEGDVDQQNLNLALDKLTNGDEIDIHDKIEQIKDLHYK